MAHVIQDQNNLDSEDISKIIGKFYLEADSDARLKKALKSRVPSYNDLVLEPGEKVFFRDEQESWDGPATVVNTEGRTVWIKWHGNLRKAATSRVLKYFEDEVVNQENQNCIMMKNMIILL